MLIFHRNPDPASRRDRIFASPAELPADLAWHFQEFGSNQDGLLRLLDSWLRRKWNLGLNLNLDQASFEASAQSGTIFQNWSDPAGQTGWFYHIQYAYSIGDGSVRMPVVKLVQHSQVSADADADASAPQSRVLSSECTILVVMPWEMERSKLHQVYASSLRLPIHVMVDVLESLDTLIQRAFRFQHVQDFSVSRPEGR